jgi:hypothetical protein
VNPLFRTYSTHISSSIGKQIQRVIYKSVQVIKRHVYGTKSILLCESIREFDFTGSKMLTVRV